MTEGRFHRLAAALTVCFACGCSADNDAMEFASQLRRLTVEYEQARDKKIEAERKFYRDQRKNLRRIIAGAEALGNVGEGDFATTKTVVYGRIITDANRDASLRAESLIASPGVIQINTSLAEFLQRGLEQDRKAYLEAQRRQQQLRENLLVELVKIDAQTQRLKTIRKKLLELEKDPTFEARFEQVVAIGKAVRKQLNTSTGTDGTQSD